MSGCEHLTEIALRVCLSSISDQGIDIMKGIAMCPDLFKRSNSYSGIHVQKLSQCTSAPKLNDEWKQFGPKQGDANWDTAGS